MRFCTLHQLINRGQCACNAHGEWRTKRVGLTDPWENREADDRHLGRVHRSYIKPVSHSLFISCIRRSIASAPRLSFPVYFMPLSVNRVRSPQSSPPLPLPSPINYERTAVICMQQRCLTKPGAAASVMCTQTSHIPPGCLSLTIYCMPMSLNPRISISLLM